MEDFNEIFGPDQMDTLPAGDLFPPTDGAGLQSVRQGYELSLTTIKLTCLTVSRQCIGLDVVLLWKC